MIKIDTGFIFTNTLSAKNAKMWKRLLATIPLSTTDHTEQKGIWNFSQILSWEKNCLMVLQFRRIYFSHPSKKMAKRRKFLPAKISDTKIYEMISSENSNL